jgi:fructosamine-3-kinase
VSILPDDIHDALTDQFGPLAAALPLSGGDVNRAARVTTSDGKIFVKWKEDAPLGFFALEADGLDRLRAAGALRIPQVLQIGEDPAFLALEYLEAVLPRDEHRFAQRLGQGLAALHRDNPAPDNLFGLDIDNYLGSQPQVNTHHDDWPSFYRDCRLAPQWEKALARGLVPPEREHLLGQIVDHIETLLGDFAPRPVLVHGDLWSGNFLATADDEPALIDPAVYYAEREVEIAYTQLFGGFPDGFFESYHAAFPLDSGYVRRRPLHHLYPLLVHLNHFGETYGPAVDRACRASLS